MTRPRHRWCLLIHALPARPLYLRARIRRLLAQSGAAPIRRSVYALPASAAALDGLRAIAAEIETAGGTGFVCEATFPDREVEASVVRAFNDELQSHYRAWIEQARQTVERMAGAAPPPHVARSDRGATARVAAARRPERLRRRFAHLESLDRFGAPGAEQAAAWHARLAPAAKRSNDRQSNDRRAFVGRTWVTRKGLHVDRLACAWLVRRFIDPAARFRFVSSPEAPLADGEIGFDMPGATIAHEQGGCSFETLARRAGIRDPAVTRVGEIVHDIDLGDGRHGHAETAGLEQMLLGLIASHPRDDDRLARGIELFDTLYAALGAGTRLSDDRGAAAPRVSVPANLRRKKPGAWKRPSKR